MFGIVDTPFSALAAKSGGGYFTLVDVGCGGGIDAPWRKLEPRLRAVCYDIDAAEIRRLSSAERNPNVRYQAGSVGVLHDDPFEQKRGGRKYLVRNPWHRLSTGHALAIERAKNVGYPPPAAPWELPLGEEITQAGSTPSSDTIAVPNHLLASGIDDVDFLKIDIDGGDFSVLSSFGEYYDILSILGIGIEVNFFGSSHPTDHSFHNVDRLLREWGFDLFLLETPRRYSMAALPGPYATRGRNRTVFGRAFQSDALYLRDICAPINAQFARRLSATKLLNYMTVAAMFGMPDVAAEALLRNEGGTGAILDKTVALDCLATQARGEASTYGEYIAGFRRLDPWFLAPA